MSDKVYEIETFLRADSEATWVTHLWDTYSTQRTVKMREWSELKRYIFAVDTRDTSNATLPWENTTTLPKICQIRDTLFANYMTAIFPSDKWLTWIAYNEDSAKKFTAETIKAYMQNKTREGGYREEIAKTMYDYIDYGNAFFGVSFESRHNDDPVDGVVPGFVGPKTVRISPEDIVFNPTAATFEDSFKVIRSIKTVGELKKLAMIEPGQAFWEKAVDRRLKMKAMAGSITRDDSERVFSYNIDGFGNLQEYYQSDFVEILEFYGDYHDIATGELQLNRMITVVDRTTVVRNVPIPTFSGRAAIRHVGWRRRPDNLWAMGPLDNLVGMQYRIDHLENAKADAYDLAIHAPLAIKGNVEPFVWGPKTVIHLDEDGDITELNKSIQAVIAADSEIDFLERKMEEFAGAPREAAGIRTPGEKTAFEVDRLDTAAGRLFQIKIVAFEVGGMEPNLNDMLELGVRNFDGSDIIRVFDDDLRAVEFRKIEKADITAKGVLRPVGARHFAQKAKELQNLVNISGSPLWDALAPHVSGLGLMEYIDDVLELTAFRIFKPNAAVTEAQETQGLAAAAQETLEVEGATPIEDEEAEFEDEDAEAENEELALAEAGV